MATIAIKYDSIHHHGVAWGLTVYFLFIHSVIWIAIINIISAVVNKKWLRWLLMVLCACGLVGMFGANPTDSPFRALFILAIILLLTLGRELLDKILFRLIPDLRYEMP
jgi:Na+/melibiose symporter-like transporter